MTVRPLTQADRPGWEPLWEGYNSFYRHRAEPEVTDLTFARLCAGEEARGAVRVYWHTQEYNGAARSLYDQVARRTSFIKYER